MKFDDLTIGQVKEIQAMLLGTTAETSFNNGMIGKYVIVRCRDAGVHSGVLKSHHGRECILTESRRIWRWIPADNQKWLSGLAQYGICTQDSRGKSAVGCPVDSIHLTENCEIILCTEKAEKSLREIQTDE